MKAALNSEYMRFIGDKRRGSGVRKAEKAVKRFVDLYNKTKGPVEPIDVLDRGEGHLTYLPPEKEMPTRRVPYRYSVVDGGHRIAIAYRQIELDNLNSRRIDYEVPVRVVEDTGQRIPDYTTYMADYDYELIPKYAEVCPTLDPEIRTLRDGIWETVKEFAPRFGRGGLYTDCDAIGICGQRNTRRRLDIYRFDRYLYPDMNVLEIGASTGFLTIEIAKLVNFVHAVENDPVSVDIMKRIVGNQKLNPRGNIKIDPRSVLEIQKRQYDAVIALAIHRWLKLPWEEFLGWLRRFVRRGGVVLIESHNIRKQDRNWKNNVSLVGKHGFRMLDHFGVDDDPKLPRCATWLLAV